MNFTRKKVTFLLGNFIFLSQYIYIILKHIGHIYLKFCEQKYNYENGIFLFAELEDSNYKKLTHITKVLILLPMGSDTLGEKNVLVATLSLGSWVSLSKLSFLGFLFYSLGGKLPAPTCFTKMLGESHGLIHVESFCKEAILHCSSVKNNYKVEKNRCIAEAELSRSA